MDLPISTTSSTGLTVAAIAGLLFGVLLHRGGVGNYNVIVNQFRLKDFTVLRIMLTAIVVGGVGIALFHNAGLAALHIKAAVLAPLITGALIFGVGMVLLGYCPGTGVVAVATGRIHAIVGFLGMLAGGIVYAFTFPAIQDGFMKIGDLGKVRLPDITGIPEYAWWIGLAVISLVLFRLLPKSGAASE
jgi:uncharacterized membrane protein YedE/YeeE